MADPVLKPKFRIPALAYPIVATIAFLAAWQAIVVYGKISPLLLPSPTQILASISKNFSLILRMSWVTASEFLLGFALAVVVGLPLGGLIVYSRPLRLAFYPLLVAFQTIPKPAIAPIIIVWIGTGLTSKVVIAFAIAFFPILVDTMIGLRSAQPETVHLLRSMGGSPMQLFWYIRFPAALPAIFAGLKVASTLAVVGAIVGEFVSADKGLGYLVLIANGDLNTSLIFACVVALTVLGLLFYYAIELLERLVLRWHVSSNPINDLH